MKESAGNRIDLLRHGETRAGPGFFGSTDTPLSPRGREQMEAALAGLGPWDCIIASPRARCADFARALARREAVPCTLDPRLQELHFGAWEGCTVTRILERDPEGLAAFWRDPERHPPPGGEPLARFRARVLAAWRELEAQQDRRLLLITHGGVLRLLLGHIRGVDPVWAAPRPGYGALYRVWLRAGGQACVREGPGALP